VTSENLIRSECFDFDFVFHQRKSTAHTSPAMFLDMIFKSWVDIQYSVLVSDIERSIILDYFISERNISSESWSLHMKSICQNHSSHLPCNEENDSINPRCKKYFHSPFNKSFSAWSFWHSFLMKLNGWNHASGIFIILPTRTVNNFKFSVIVRVSDLAHVQEIFSISINRFHSILVSYLITWNNHLRKIGSGFRVDILALLEYCSQTRRCRTDNEKRFGLMIFFVEFQSWAEESWMQQLPENEIFCDKLKHI
jgi:hypothetical protein